MSVPMRVSRVLIPVDFSDTSRKAFYVGLKYAKLLDADTWVLHIQEPIRYFDSSFERVEEVDTELARLETGVRRRVNELFEQGGFSEVDRRRVSIAVSGGKPHSEIIRFAVENDIDLVVMGTHGYTGMKAILIGSVAERVVRFAPCQVLCVKPDDYRSPLTDGIG